MVTKEQLRQGLDMLVDGAISADMHPVEIKEELEAQIEKLRAMMKQAYPDDQF